MTPLVSVVVTTWNHERFVGRALESALAQEAPFPFEVVVGADLSTDRTRDVVADVAARHPGRVRAIFPPERLGANEMYARAQAAARGRYLALLEGDDWWTSTGKLRLQVDLLEAEPGHAGCFHEAVVVQEDGGEREYVGGLEKAAVTAGDLIGGNFVPTSSVVIRREALDAIPSWVFDHEFADWLMHLAVTRTATLAYLPEPLSAYRVHGGGLWSSRDRASQLREEIDTCRVLPRLLGGEHAEAVAAAIADRELQLAVEDAGVPFDGPVIVAGAAAPTYLNGRAVWHLDPDVGDAAAVERLETMRAEARRAAPGAPHWRPPGPAVVGSGRAYLLVPAAGRSWLEARPRLHRHLEASYPRIHDGREYALHDLTPAGLDVLRVAGLSTAESDGGALAGAHIDRPRPGEEFEGHALRLAGWVLGREARATTLEVVREGDLLTSAPIDGARPDVGAAFPAVAGAEHGGFSAVVAVGDGPADVALRAVLADGTRVPVGEIRVAR